MTIPSCYDPVFQEDRRQADWDSYVKELPVCKLCGKTLFPGDRFHTAGYATVCAFCVEELNDNIETVEDPD